MKIVCAASLTRGREAFSTIGDVIHLPEKSITPEVIRDADALVIRSRVAVTEALLRGSRVSFVGTATAGTDHLDTAALAAREIFWCSAPGCNANSVAEYVVAALLSLAVRHRLTLTGKVMGVIGAGHVGSRVAVLAGALGLRVLCNDPPLAAQAAPGTYVALEELLAVSDMVTLHVPLVDSPPWPTRTLAGRRFFSALKPGGIFINASRGEVVDEAALMDALHHGGVAHAVLDVFAAEPQVRRDLAARAEIITPHIAGHSYEGKLNGTIMVYRKACHFFENVPAWDPARSDTPLVTLHAEAGNRRDEDVLNEIVAKAYDIESDDALLRSGLRHDEGEAARHFEKLRAEYPVRREFAHHQVAVKRARPALLDTLRGLGFRLASTA